MNINNFTCESCKYVTTIKGNYLKHCSTQKHIINIKEFFLCDVCSYKTSNKYNYNLHTNTQKHILNINTQKHISNINKEEKNIPIQQDDTLINTVKTIQKQLEQFNQKIEQVDGRTNNNEQKLKNMEKSRSQILHLLNKVMQNNPSIEYINQDTIIYQLEEFFKIDTYIKDTMSDLEKKHKLSDTLLNLFNNNKLVEYLTLFIKQLYTKENKREQSIFNTDPSRLNYVIKENDEPWTYDKKGIKYVDNIIDPLIRNIYNVLLEYNNDMVDMYNMEYELDIFMGKKQQLKDLMTQLKNNKIKKKILQETSNYLFINTNALLQIDK